jgi:hypothetical protein
LASAVAAIRASYARAAGLRPACRSDAATRPKARAAAASNGSGPQRGDRVFADHLDGADAGSGSGVELSEMSDDRAAYHIALLPSSVSARVSWLWACPTSLAETDARSTCSILASQVIASSLLPNTPRQRQSVAAP